VAQLTDLENTLSGKWVTQYALETDYDTKQLIKKAFKYAFHAGAGACQSLNDKKDKKG
jgi:hypothetical protein